MLREDIDNLPDLGPSVLVREVTSESSEGEFVEGEEKPWPPEERKSRQKSRRAPRYPRPHSHLFRKASGQPSRGNKHARRYENCECYLVGTT